MIGGEFLTAHVIYFFFNDTATTEIYTLSLHDALPIWNRRGHRPGARRRRRQRRARRRGRRRTGEGGGRRGRPRRRDRKSTRLNSSHANISYAVFCLKKKQHIHTSLSYLPLYQ